MQIISGHIQRAIILFVRRPILGKVKTRLAQELGDARALEIYRLLLCHTHYILATSDARLYVYYSDAIEEVDMWSDIAHSKRLQVTGDLGARMQHAFDEVLTDHDHALIIGSDCAQLRQHHITHAWRLLESEDVVIGPTYDGGYYLLGIKAMHPSLFDEMPWSTERVAELTIKRAADAGLKTGQIDKLSDIDYKEDWDEYGSPYILP